MPSKFPYSYKNSSKGMEKMNKNSLYTKVHLFGVHFYTGTNSGIKNAPHRMFGGVQYVIPDSKINSFRAGGTPNSYRFNSAKALLCGLSQQKAAHIGRLLVVFRRVAYNGRGRRT